MIDDIIVLSMTDEHVPAVAELERLCFSDPWTEQGIAAELKNPTAHFFTAIYDNHPVGYAGVHVVAGEGYIANIATHPELRRCGIAKKLMQRMLKLAIEEKMSFLTLEVRVSNIAAISLYESFGFEQVGRRRNFYRYPTEDALLMSVYPLGREE